jgi:hypothetical protein
MKINLTQHERNIVIAALVSVGTVISMHLAEKINQQDPAEDGSEVAILKSLAHLPEGWDA